MTRDSLIWTISFLAGLIAFVVAETHLIPEAYVPAVRDIGAVLAFIGGKLGMSFLNMSQEGKNQARIEGTTVRGGL